MLKDKQGNSEKREFRLTGILIFLLIIFGFLWYSQLTETSDGLINFAHKSIKNMGKIFTEEIRGEGASFGSQFDIFYQKKDVKLLLINYTNDTISNFYKEDWKNFYETKTYEKYTTRPISAQQIPLKLDYENASKIYLFIEILKKLVKIFALVGVFYLLFYKLKKQKINSEYIIMILWGGVLIATIVLLPLASIEYDLMRTSQQILIILSLPTILGGLIIFRFFKENIKIFVIFLIFIFYFLFSSGFVPQIIGGLDTSMQLNNFGENYNEFYVHDTEIHSGKWLLNNYLKKDILYGDKRAIWKIWLSGKLDEKKIVTDIFPPIIDKQSYVYSGYTNTINKKSFLYPPSGRIIYNYPTNFLEQNKNKLYNNGGSEIFK